MAGERKNILEHTALLASVAINLSLGCCPCVTEGRDLLKPPLVKEWMSLSSKNSVSIVLNKD